MTTGGAGRGRWGIAIFVVFVLSIFPVFWIVAAWLHERKALFAVTAVSFAGFSLLGLAFMNWKPIF